MVVGKESRKLTPNMPKNIKKKKKLSRERVIENLFGYAFLFPMLLNIIIFLVLPIIFSLIMSFAHYDMMAGLSSFKFAGLDHFRAIFKDEWFISSMKNTLLFSLFTVPIGISIGLILATLVNDYVYTPNFSKISLFLPYISSTIASAVVWNVLLQPSFGPVNELLKSIGIANPPGWFADFDWALVSIIIFSIWQQMGYTVLVYMAGLKGVPQELYESAQIDGAGPVRKFFSITLPMVSPTTFFLLIMGLIQSFKVFDIVSALTSGGPGTSTTVIAYYIYREAFRYYEMGKASAAAWIMFIIIFIITMFQWRQQKKWTSHE